MPIESGLYHDLLLLDQAAKRFLHLAAATFATAVIGGKGFFARLGVKAAP